MSFNTDDAIELDLLIFADRPDINFSGLVKNLLFAYNMGQMREEQLPQTTQKPNFDKQTALKKVDCLLISDQYDNKKNPDKD